MARQKRRLAIFTPRLDHLPKLRLSDTCRLLGLTPRAFRFYEEQGLIGSGRDALNHRLVDGPTRRRVARIVQLRRVGLSIRQVREILDEEDGGDPRAGVDLALSRLAVRREEIQAELDDLDALADDLAEAGALTDAPRMPAAA